MINLKDKLKSVVNAFRKEPIAITEGFKKLEQVNRAASKTGQEIQRQKERSLRS